MSTNRIKDLREDRDLRQTDVAEATGIDQRTLSNYETGKTNPDSFALIRLADFFDVSIDYLLGRTNLRKDTADDVLQELQAARSMLDDAMSALRRMGADI
ncbi:MAG: helix-turn-helix transcriptional regulator [Christensenellales bacterium]|nr:helix-turn-helix transcriptional regulator [Christensenellales bacterium]